MAWDVPTGTTSTKGETMCSNANCENYQGWANRETWALNLWLSNDQGLYEMIRERVAEAVALAVRNARHTGFGTTGPIVKFPTTEAWLQSAGGVAYLARVAGGAVQDAWDELTDPAEGLLGCESILAMVRDVGSEYRVAWDEIGSEYRVAWDEIGAAWLDGVDES